MATVKINVKWSGKKFDDVEVDLSQPGAVFKTQLFSLTGVPPERQKIMVKGGLLKDDADMSKLGLKEGASLMMMGTAEVLAEPAAKTVFMEDMTDAQLAQVLEVPSGLVNLGNTCYLNSTLQTLRAIPELATSLAQVTGSLGIDNRKNLPVALKQLYSELSKTAEAVPPLVFLQVLRSAFPQFAEQGRGGYLQQDAEEVMNSIVSCLKDGVPGVPSAGESGKGPSFVEQFMTGELSSSLTCDEAPEEAPKESSETFVKMSVNISGGVVTYMTQEITNSLTQKIEKRSETLDRTAVYTQTSRISRLPKYLTFQFIRFQWKPAERVRAKILKRVKFPFDLDMTPYVTPELLKKMIPARDHLRASEEAKAAKQRNKTKNDSNEKGKGPEAMEVDAKPTRTDAEIMKEIGIDEGLSGDVGACVHGQYELVAVITHLGRTADGGHYIAWVKKGGDEWHKFDDDKVSIVNSEEITKLEGGGEYHSAYICLYKAKPLE